jgi:alcohol dehydrogenase (cytochrome c)
VFEDIPNDGRYGTFTAIDVATGKVRWQRKAPRHLALGGALATAGGLVFFGQTDGLLLALDAETGAVLWQHQVGDLPLGPPISFMDRGRQRIAVASGRGVAVFGLPGR